MSAKRPRIAGLSILITTICNQTCPRCCYAKGIVGRKTDRRHFTIAELMQHAHLFHGLDKIYINGGEPTLHPKLGEIIQLVRAKMMPRVVVIDTYGENASAHIDALALADQVVVSGINNGRIRAWKLRNALRPRRRPVVSVNTEQHVQVALDDATGSGKICWRASVPAYVGGKLFPCCATPGIEGSEWIEPTESWRDDLKRMELPCNRCGFSGAGCKI